MVTVVALGLGRGVLRGVEDGVGHKKRSRVRNGAEYPCAVAQSQCLVEDLKKIRCHRRHTPTPNRGTQSRRQNPHYICAVAQSQCLKETSKINSLSLSPSLRQRNAEPSRVARIPKQPMSQVFHGAVDDSLLVPTLLRLFDGWPLCWHSTAPLCKAPSKLGSDDAPGEVQVDVHGRELRVSLH